MITGSNDRFRLTNREKDIMDILWTSPKALVASEITSIRDDLSINTVQAVLKKLLHKNLIQVDEIVYSGTVLSRSYKPTLAPEEFEIQKFASSYSQTSGKPFLPSNLIATLLEEETDSSKVLSEIDKLEEYLASKKQELKDGTKE